MTFAVRPRRLLETLAAGCLAALLSGGAACGGDEAHSCDNDEYKCADPKRPYCDLDGTFPESDGVSRTCIPDPYLDAGVDAAP